ncbi:hypothetical protein FRC00_014161, partial [Tulasnella sp. 408]
LSGLYIMSIHNLLDNDHHSSTYYDSYNFNYYRHYHHDQNYNHNTHDVVDQIDNHN